MYPSDIPSESWDHSVSDPISELLVISKSMRNSPFIHSVYQLWINAFKNPHQMKKNGLPNPKFELVQQVNCKGFEYVETKRSKSL